MKERVNANGPDGGHRNWMNGARITCHVLPYDGAIGLKSDIYHFQRHRNDKRRLLVVRCSVPLGHSWLIPKRRPEPMLPEPSPSPRPGLTSGAPGKPFNCWFSARNYAIVSFYAATVSSNLATVFISTVFCARSITASRSEAGATSSRVEILCRSLTTKPLRRSAQTTNIWGQGRRVRQRLTAGFALSISSIPVLFLPTKRGRL